MRRAVHNLPDELRGARGARETTSRYAYDICYHSHVLRKSDILSVCP